MFVLPEDLQPFSDLPAPVVWRSYESLVRTELPSPLSQAAYVFSTVLSDSGMLVCFAEAFDAACLQLPCLPPEDWAVLEALEQRGLLTGGMHRRVFVGLQLQHLSTVQRCLVQSVASVDPRQELEPAVLSLLAELCLT